MGLSQCNKILPGVVSSPVPCPRILSDLGKCDRFLVVVLIARCFVGGFLRRFLDCSGIVRTGPSGWLEDFRRVSSTWERGMDQCLLYF